MIYTQRYTQRLRMELAGCIKTAEAERKLAEEELAVCKTVSGESGVELPVCEKAYNDALGRVTAIRRIAGNLEKITGDLEKAAALTKDYAEDAAEASEWIHRRGGKQ